ncbi:MAG: hypothetical protein Tsb009_23930 [Planctomycetaceae bacterium]
MHYDKKISFALAILLIGIVAAFFFRNEKQSETEVPQLKNPETLDTEIAKKQIQPYKAPSRLSGKIQEQIPKQNSTESLPPYDELPIANSPTLSSKPPENITLGPPDPIPTSAETAPTQNSSISSSNSSWEPIARKTVQAEIVSQRTYRVKSGDTLSGIAHRFLGSSARFREIYEANRVLLQSPDDLREGMILRIPPRKRGTNSPRVAAPPENAEVTSTTSKPSKSVAPVTESKSTTKNQATKSADKKRRPRLPTGRFIPIRRSPFRRRGELTRPVRQPLQGASAGPKPSPESNKRKLTSKPPATIPVINSNIWSRDKVGTNPTRGKKNSASSVNSKNAPRAYVVRPGDSLEKIAIRFYGTSRAVNKILTANRGRIRNPRYLQVGTQLILPQ